MYIRRRFLSNSSKRFSKPEVSQKKKKSGLLKSLKSSKENRREKKAKSASAVRENHSLQQGKNSAFSDNTKAKAKEILCEKKKKKQQSKCACEREKFRSEKPVQVPGSKSSRRRSSKFEVKRLIERN